MADDYEVLGELDDDGMVPCKFCGVACYWKETKYNQWRLYEDLEDINKDKLHVCKEYKKVKNND